MAKRYYKRVGRKRRRTSRYARRSSKYSAGNRRTGGLYRIATKGYVRRRKLARAELKYLDSVFSNDSCRRMDNGGDGPNVNIPFNGTTEQRWYINKGNQSADDNLQGGCCRPTQGAGAQQRIGRKICLKSLFMRWHFKEALASNTDVLGGGARILVLLDTQANGAYPTDGNVFGGTSGSSSAATTGGIDQAMRLQDIENSQRFRVLMDKIVMVSSPSGVNFNTAADPGVVSTGVFRQTKSKYYSKYLKLPNIEIEMGGDKANITLCKTNCVHILVCPVGGPMWISANIRTRFSDL